MTQMIETIETNPLISIDQGDILAIRGRGWLADGIVKIEYNNRPNQYSVSHVGLFLSRGNANEIPIVIEALNRVKTNLLRESINDAEHAFVLHNLSLLDWQRSSIIETACKFSTYDYGYLDLGAQWFDAVLKTSWWTNQLANYLSHRPICSYVVSASYASARLNFAIEDCSCKPNDIMFFALTHPEIYQVTQIK